MHLKKRIPEKELVVRLQLNDKAAFEYLYEQYAPAFNNLLCKILKDKENAADTLQDSFIKIWLGIGSYNTGKGTLFTWMLNITRNTAIDKIRSDSKYGKFFRLEDLLEVDLTNATVYNPSISTIDVRDVIDRMGPKTRQLLIMTYFQGYTNHEISEQLSIPVGTVKSRARKALRDLRQLYGASVN